LGSGQQTNEKKRDRQTNAVRDAQWTKLLFIKNNRLLKKTCAAGSKIYPVISHLFFVHEKPEKITTSEKIQEKKRYSSGAKQRNQILLLVILSVKS